MTVFSQQLVGGRYRVLHEIGKGGFGETYLAQDTHLHEQKCVIKKFIYTSNNSQDLAKAQELFEREANILHWLGKKHPQIPELFASFKEDNDFYLVQEWIDGETFSSELKRKGKLNEEEIKQFLQEILELLQYVHDNNVIHRDIKPDNIMRRREDNKLVLIDFGCVKQFITANRQLNHPNNRTCIGTEGYAAKEQLWGNPQFSSDIYSMGMTLVFALTAIQPKDLSRDHHTNQLLWQNYASDVSKDLISIINKMIEENFSDRYQTIQNILKDLDSPQILPTLPINPQTVIPHNSRITTIPILNIPLKPTLIVLVPMVILVGFGAGFSLFKNGNSPPPVPDPSPTNSSRDPLPPPDEPDNPPETETSRFLCPDPLKGQIPSCS
ncbi:MAG: serine/threonine-protein kinase [Crocosphaera sp.]|nr:serine/threonine-protein kinase [Crocosphaera sp.]